VLLGCSCSGEPGRLVRLRNSVGKNEGLYLIMERSTVEYTLPLHHEGRVTEPLLN